MSETKKPGAGALCPICAKEAPVPAYRPFCSKRCADVDLGRWFSGRYVVPGPAGEEDGDSAPDES